MKHLTIFRGILLYCGTLVENPRIKLMLSTVGAQQAFKLNQDSHSEQLLQELRILQASVQP